VILIKFENIYVKKKDKVILNHISGEIREGDRILITGPSGSGKTTFLKTLLFFDYPETAEISFQNRKVSKKDIHQYRSVFGYIGQNPPAFTGKTSSLMRFMVRNIEDKHKQLMELMDFFSLDDKLLDSSFLSLSNGEKQRINIIISLLLNRNIYLLDEITSNLDPENVQKTIRCFSREDLTCLVVSHQEEWQTFATRRWNLNGTLKEVNT